MIFNLAATFISAALLIPNVIAQAPTGTGDIPACVLNCTLSSLSAGGCTSVTQLSCICTSIPFQTAAGTCIATTCPDQSQAAISIQNATCGPYLAGLSSSGSGSATATGSSSSSSSAAPGTTGAAGTTAPPASTTSRSAGFHTASIASGVTLALFGAAFSLF